ncbi:MAG: hypothetical protein HZA09_03035 [Nitrospirae bacterium]|nr:hypothetical protein [Nitrospirota bacterium]
MLYHKSTASGEKLKKGWIHFTEENEQAELKSGAAPCCDLEELERRRIIWKRPSPRKHSQQQSHFLDFSKWE